MYAAAESVSSAASENSRIVGRFLATGTVFVTVRPECLEPRAGEGEKLKKMNGRGEGFTSWNEANVTRGLSITSLTQKRPSGKGVNIPSVVSR